MGRSTQGGIAQRNLKCVQLTSRVGICQRDPVLHTCGELLYRFAFGHYSSYAKVAELKKTLCVEQFEQFAKANKRTRPCKDIDEVPWSRGDSRKNSCGMSRFSRGSITGKERRLLERGGTWEGGRVCRTIRIPTSTSVGGFSQSCPNKSGNKTGHRWCQCHPPKQSKRDDFCWTRFTV